MYRLCLTLIVLLFSLMAFLPDSYAKESKSEEATLEALEGRSLEEILEEEKTNKYKKLDDFLKDFDKGFSKNMGEKFEDLLIEDAFVDKDDEINTDSFETFNEQFDKMIEEDLADFEMFELNIDQLDVGLNIKEVGVISRADHPSGEAR